MKNELHNKNITNTTLTYNCDKKMKIVFANDHSSLSPAKKKVETRSGSKRKNKETVSKSNLSTSNMNLVDLEKMYNKIHTKEVAKIVTNAYKYKKVLKELDKKPNLLISSENKMSEYFDLTNIKAKYEMAKKNFKVDKNKENLKKIVLQHNIKSVVGNFIKENEEAKTNKLIEERITERNIEKLIKKNRSKSTCTEEVLTNLANNKKNSVFQLNRAKHSSVNFMSNFNSINSSRENSLLLDEEKLLRKIKERTKNSPGTFYKFKQTISVRNSINNSRDKTTQCATFRENLSNLRTIRQDDETKHSKFFPLHENANLSAQNSKRRSSCETPKKFLIPSSANTERKVPKINLDKLDFHPLEIPKLPLFVSLTERKNVDKSNNSHTIIPPEKDPDSPPHSSKKLVGKFNFETIGTTGNNINTLTARVSRGTSNTIDKEDELFKLNRRFFKKYNNIQTKFEVDKSEHLMKQVFDKEQVDLLVNSNYQIDLESLKNDYQSALKIASMYKKEKLLRNIKLYRERKINTIKLLENNRLDLHLSKEKSNNTVVSTKMIEEFDNKEKKRRMIKKLMVALKNVTKDYMVIEDS